MLAASIDAFALPSIAQQGQAVMADLVHLRNDVATSALALVNAVQPSPTNTPAPASLINQWYKVENVLIADVDQTLQAFTQFEYAVLGAYQQVFDTLLTDVGIRLPDQAPSLSPPDTDGDLTIHPRSGPNIGDPAISAIEGVNWFGTVATIGDSDSDGTQGQPEIVSGSINWGDGSSTAFSLQVPEGGGADLNENHTWTETGSYTVTISVTDPDGGSSQASEIASVADGQLSWYQSSTAAPSVPPSWTQTFEAAPSITTPANQTNTEGDSVSLQVQASDSDGDALSYDALDLPPGLSINASTGLISGTVAYGAAEDFGGSYNPTIIVDDGRGGSNQTSFAWTINPAQVAPVLTNPGNQINLRGDNVSLQLNATQTDNNPLTYSASNLPTDLSIDSETGLISGTVDPSATLGVPYAVTVTTTDDTTNLSTSQTFNWTINATNVAPVLTSSGNQTNSAGDQVSLQLSATDADGDALTYTATGLPPGLTLGPIAGTITGTLPNSAASSTPYNVTVTASDGMASNSQSFTWTVNAVSLPNPGAQSNLDGDSVSLQLTGSDANGQTLTYSATGLPPGLSISSTGLISGTLSSTADTGSPYAVTVTAKDSANNSISQSFNWTVSRLALNNPGNQENQEGKAVSLQLSATDHEGTPTYSATGLPPGLSISSSGLISGTLGTAAHGSSPYQVTVTATDGSYTSSQSFVWTVTPRVALVNPGPQSNATGDTVSLQLSATSPGGTMTYSASGLPPGLSISSTGLISGSPTTASSTPYTVTVTANDGTSSSSQTFPWTVSVINLVSPGDQTNNDGDTVSLSLTTGYHGSGTLSYSATGLPTGLSISSTTGQITGTISGTADTNSPYSVTVTVTDGTNTSSQTFNWTVNAVVTIDSIDDQSNTAGDAVSLQVTASDSENKTLTYSATNLPTGLTISSTSGLISGTIALGAESSSPYAVTVTATDSSGNSASQSFNWTVAHVALVNPGPQWSVDSAAVSLQLQGKDADGNTVTYTASGLPSGLSINTSTGLISGTIASNADTTSPYNVTVTASDGAHTTTQTFLWTVSQVALTTPSAQINTEGDTVSLQLQGMASSGTLIYNASGLPSGLSLNTTTGLISGTLAAGDAANGPYTVDVSITNGVDSTSQTFTWTINPVVNLTTPANQSNVEGNNVSLQMSATDSLGKSLTYMASGLPSGLSISSSGLISGTISSGDAANGPYLVIVTTSDGTYSSSTNFGWNITHTDTTALTMTNPGSQVNVASDYVMLQIDASDPDGIDSLSYSAMGLPDGLNILSETGLIYGTLADDAASKIPYQVTVSADDGNGQMVSQTFSWLVNAPAITAQALPISAVEGSDTGSITLATFTTPDLNSQVGDFTAIINWGDDNTDEGVVSVSNGSFIVTDAHIYDEKGSYPVSITIINNVTRAIATVTTTATVADAALTVTGGFEYGDSFTKPQSGYTLATFTDADPYAPLSDYTVTINWGDGNTTSGSGSTYVQSGGDGFYYIVAPHDYANPYPQPGPTTYTVTVTLTDVDGASAQVTDTVVVGVIEAAVPATMGQWAFVDQNSIATPSDFVYNGQTGVALINWGDGTTSLGTISGGGTSGFFSIVAAPHTYVQDSMDQLNGLYTITVTVTDDDGNTLTGTQYVSVVRPPVSLDSGDVETTLTSLSLSNVQVAAFTVPDAVDAASEFSATIDWGDKSSSSGTIQQVVAGLFEVIGSHTYSDAGEYAISVTVSQGWSAMAPAARRNADSEAGKDKPVITGPKAVPGNSMYTFTIDNPKIASEGDKLVSLTISAPQGSQAQGFAYNARRKPNTKSTLEFDVYFYNSPGLLNMTATFQRPDKEKSTYKATGSVFVVQVTVTDPPGGSFTPSTQTADVPKPIVKAHVLKGLSSAPPGQAGLAWKAKVTLNPKNSGWLSNIEVGFVQHLYVQDLHGYYGKNKQGEDLRRYSRMMGRKPPYLDKITGDKFQQSPANSPFYSILAPNTELPPDYHLPPGVPKQAIFTGSARQNSATIGSSDSPVGVVPWSLNYTASNDVNKQPKPYAQWIGFRWLFTLDVVAHIAGNGPYSNTYWPQARMEWQFTGTQPLDPNVAGLPWVKGKGNSFVHVGSQVGEQATSWEAVGPYYIPTITWPFLQQIPLAIPEDTKIPAIQPLLANDELAKANYG